MSLKCPRGPWVNAFSWLEISGPLTELHAVVLRLWPLSRYRMLPQSGGDVIQVAVTRLLAGPQEADFWGIFLWEEMQDIVNLSTESCSHIFQQNKLNELWVIIKKLSTTFFSQKKKRKKNQHTKGGEDWLITIVNSLAPGRSEGDFKNVIFNFVLLIGLFRFS